MPGCTQQRDAVAVDLAGDRQVALPEACLAAPREVRVGQHHAAARRGDVAADRPPVGREPRTAQGVHRRRRVGSVGARRLCPADQVRQVPAAAHERHVAQEGVQVQLVDRPDPRGAGAPRGQGARGGQFAEALVVAADVAGDELAYPSRLGVAQRPSVLDDAERPVPQVRGQVVFARTGAVEQRPLAAHLDDLVRDGRQVVTGDRPALTEAQSPPGVRADVRHAVFGEADLCFDVDVTRRPCSFTTHQPPPCGP